jgi:O-antigen ligase
LAWLAVLGLPPLAISALPLGPQISVQAEEWARELSKDNKGQASQEEAELRIHNWGEAMNRGLESGMLGLGPGPHLDIPASLVAARKAEVLPKYVEPPEANGTPNFEAHNTPLDLFTQGGLIAVLSFVWLSGVAFVSTWKARLAGLTTLLFGISLFGIGNLIIRQPLFWFTIALCLVSEARTISPARNWS